MAPSLTLSLVEWLGVAVFALSGVMVAARTHMDPFGFSLLATVTGVGGGTLRDLLLGVKPVFWVADPTEVLICVSVAIVTFAVGPGRFAVVERKFPSTILLWADAVGLALFAVLGTAKAVSLGVPAFSAIVLGTMTATFGGILRDILAGEPSLVLRKEIYITAAAVGAAVYVQLQFLGFPPGGAAAIGATVAFALRGLAILRGWSLPNFSS
jgi:uncharacterized membrane protein YeiH